MALLSSSFKCKPSLRGSCQINKKKKRYHLLFMTMSCSVAHPLKFRKSENLKFRPVRLHLVQADKGTKL